MGTVSEKKLLKLWKLEELTVEMAIGQLLQHLNQLHQVDEQQQRQHRASATVIKGLSQELPALKARLEQLTDSLKKLRADVDALIAHTGMPPKTK